MAAKIKYRLEFNRSPDARGLPKQSDGRSVPNAIVLVCDRDSICSSRTKVSNAEVLLAFVFVKASKAHPAAAATTTMTTYLSDAHTKKKYQKDVMMTCYLTFKKSRHNKS